MKREKVKENKNILLIAGTTASVVMIVIVLIFSIGSITKISSVTGGTITGSSINLKEGQSSESYTKPEIDALLEKKYQEIIISNAIFNETSRKELSGNGNAYLCINSEGKIFRSEIPCK